MTVTIKTLGVEVPGHIVKKFDGKSTTLLLDEAQARLLHEELGTVVAFFDSQSVKPPGP